MNKQITEIQKARINQNNVLGTSGGEMPDALTRITSESFDNVSYAFGLREVQAERIPESRGDLADQAQEGIDAALEDKISAIRRKNLL